MTWRNIKSIDLENRRFTLQYSSSANNLKSSTVRIRLLIQSTNQNPIEFGEFYDHQFTINDITSNPQSVSGNGNNTVESAVIIKTFGVSCKPC